MSRIRHLRCYQIGSLNRILRRLPSHLTHAWIQKCKRQQHKQSKISSIILKKKKKRLNEWKTNENKIQCCIKKSFSSSKFPVASAFWRDSWAYLLKVRKNAVATGHIMVATCCNMPEMCQDTLFHSCKSGMLIYRVTDGDHIGPACEFVCNPREARILTLHPLKFCSAFESLELLHAYWLLIHVGDRSCFQARKQHR